MTLLNSPSKPHKGRDYWQQHISTWEADGGTQSNYCRQHKLSERLFSLWKNKFIKEQRVEMDEKVEFVAVQTSKKAAPAINHDGVTIALPNGIRLDVPSCSSGAAIAELASHLVSLSC